jgi:thiol-disulfide isomerase/thioredoxin
MKVMKNLVMFLLSLSATSTIAQQAYHIEGRASSLQEQDKLYLVYDSGDKQLTDSAFVKGGKFSFKGSIQYPVMAALYLHKNPYFTQLKKGEQMDYLRFYLEAAHMSMTSADSVKNMNITGSPANTAYKQLLTMLEPNEKRFTALRKEFEALDEQQKKDKVIFQRILDREHQLLLESYTIHLKFAEQNPKSYLSVISLSHVAPNPELSQQAATVFEKLDPQLKKSPLAQGIPEQLAAPENTRIGNLAPDFTQPSPDGVAVKLSDFKGKYVLLDFWASWCGPCREENPNLVNTYKHYSPKNFIFGVSLDRGSQRNAWLKAIEKDELTWTQAGDMLGWENKAAKIYGVRAIPANFLIDPSGKIVARDLRAEDLNKKLRELIGE